MHVSERKYLPEYLKIIGNEIPRFLAEFDFSEGNGDFDYLTKASAVYSSNIEGNSIDLNSFMNYELSKEKFKPGKEIEEIENLVAAYRFAQQNKLNEANLLACHKILSETLLVKSKRGKYRTGRVGVFGASGLVYLAVEPQFVKREMKQLFSDVSLLLKEVLPVQEVFYFASLLHLVFVHIHPFRDGNGRVARLLEKWFLAEKLGKKYWKIPSEEYYKTHQETYYEALNLGVNYYELNYDRCMGFLTLLPYSLKKNKNGV